MPADLDGNNDFVHDFVISRLAKLHAREPSSISPQDNLADLGLDSLDLVELMMAVEEEFESDVPDDEAAHIESVQDLIDAVRRHRP